MHPANTSSAHEDRAPLAERAVANLIPALISFTNQALMSVTNFVVALVLVRWLSPEAYGTYGMGLAVCYLYAGVGNAVFLTQMVVRAPSQRGDEKAAFAGRILLSVLVFVVATLLAVTGITLAAYAVLGASSLLVRISIPLALASVSYLLKDFFIRWAYSTHREGQALLVNSSVMVAMGVLLGGVGLAGVQLSAAGALLVYAAALAAGAFLGGRLVGVTVRGARLGKTVSDLKDCWGHGRWALGGVAVTWIQSQAYAYATLAVLGIGEVGRANAIRLFISPMLLATPAINQLAMPRYAELRDRDPSRMMRTARWLTGGLCFAGMSYGAVLILFGDRVIPHLLGTQYSGGGALLLAWCGVMCATLARDGASTLLQAMMRFRELTIATATSAGAALVAALICMRWWGAAGAIAGTALGELLLATFLWRKVANVRSSVR